MKSKLIVTHHVIDMVAITYSNKMGSSENLSAWGSAVANIKGQLAIIRTVEKQLKLRIFSYEYEILVVLYDCGPTTAGDLLSQSSASSTAFYAALKYLLEQDMIEGHPETEDRRRMRYRLTAACEGAFRQIYEAVLRWTDKHIDHPQPRPRGFSAFVRGLKDIMPLRYLATDYHILLLVYENDEINAGDLLHLCETSSTTFYVALRRLCDRGLLLATKDAQDKRRTHYCVAPHVRDLMTEAHRHGREWMRHRLGLSTTPPHMVNA